MTVLLATGCETGRLEDLWSWRTPRRGQLWGKNRALNFLIPVKEDQCPPVFTRWVVRAPAAFGRDDAKGNADRLI